MGTKYTTNSSSGYNATPPPDDGTTGDNNKLTWEKHKTKLTDPIKTLADAINTDLVAHFDVAPVSKTAAYTTVADDDRRVIECTSSPTITLGAAATMGDDYMVTVKNAGTGTVTVATSNTIDGSSDNRTLAANECEIYKTNAAASGYLLVNRYYSEDNSPDDIITTAGDIIIGNTSATAIRSPNWSIRDVYRNLVITRPSVTTVTVTADDLILTDSNGIPYKASSVSVTPDITASGANGLDTGAEASDTWYYIWVIYNGTTVAGCLSASASAPSVSGYTYYALVGAVRNTSSDFVDFKQVDKDVFYKGGYPTLVASTSDNRAGSWASVSVTSAFPATAKMTKVRMPKGGWAAESDGSRGAYGVFGNAGSNFDFNSLFGASSSDIQTLSAPYESTMYYMTSNGGEVIYAIGWSY